MSDPLIEQHDIHQHGTYRLQTTASSIHQPSDLKPEEHIENEASNSDDEAERNRLRIDSPTAQPPEIISSVIVQNESLSQLHR